MIWFFSREGDRLRYEISRDGEGQRYRVVITEPDGSERIVDVDNPTELVERSVALMSQLRDEGWKIG
jgi:hypothetical protein